MENPSPAGLLFLRSVQPGKVWSCFSYSTCKMEVVRTTCLLSLRPQPQDEEDVSPEGKGWSLAAGDAPTPSAVPAQSSLAALPFCVPPTGTAGVFSLVLRHLPRSLHCGAAEKETELFGVL